MRNRQTKVLKYKTGKNMNPIHVECVADTISGKRNEDIVIYLLQIKNK